MPKSSRFSLDDFEQMKDLYTSGLSTKQIALQFNTDGGTVYHHLERMGIVFRTPSQSKKQYAVWDTAFETIDSEEKAYWLGFLYADGCVYQQGKGRGKLVLILQEGDYSHIDKFRAFLQSDYPIRFFQKSKSAGFIISSDQLFSDLVKHGCRPRKSLYLKWPDFLEFRLFRHFIRGYFDGDGSAYESGKHRIPLMSFMTDIDFVTPLSHAIYYGTNVVAQVYKHRVAERGRLLVIKGEYKVQAFGSWLYKDATVFLERKYEIFLNFRKPGKRNYPSAVLYGSDAWDYQTPE